MSDILQIKEDVKKIKERNARVEAEKAWEISPMRRASIALGTYVVAVILLVSIGAPNPIISALVPSVAYILSTISIPIIKEWWLRRRMP